MMLEKICALARRYDMFGQCSNVVCGLSGGADSVGLLLALHELSDTLGITVSALHVNHCLRGAESDRDENFCRELCQRMGISFKAVSCDVKSYANEHSLSDEEAARILRYRLFAENSEGALIATAHNAGDVLETALLNLIRGTGLKGIASIPPVRGNIVRPMLTVTRKEIEAFLEEHGQEHITDSTNLTEDYTRNKIRRRIIPLMQEINPSLIPTSIHSMETLREENEFIESETDRVYSACRNGNALSCLSGHAAVIRKRCIARLLSDNSVPYSSDRLVKADEILVNGGKLNVSGRLFLIGENGGIRLESIPEEAGYCELSADLQIGDNPIFPDRVLNCRIIKCDDLTKLSSVHKKLTFYMLDYDKIIGRAVVRNRRYGDRIKLCGRDHTSSVKKLINERVPAEKRSTMHFIEDEQGTIFAEHIGIAGRVAVTADTRNCLILTVRTNN